MYGITVPPTVPQRRAGDLHPRHFWNVDLARVALYTAVQSGLAVCALVGTTGYGGAKQMGLQWLSVFGTSMGAKMSHASALNGGVTVGKVA